MSEVVDEAGQRLVHEAAALRSAGQAIADFTTARGWVEVEQLGHADQFAVVTSIDAQLEHLAGGTGVAVFGQCGLSLCQRLPGAVVPVTHDLRVGHDGKPRFGILGHHRAQLQARAFEAQVSGKTVHAGHAGPPVRSMNRPV
ncbi:hypothetical protein D3C76_1523280 [compost metagenome]